eukprot:1157573-Pelagomonas_calceolata.AAC.2
MGSLSSPGLQKLAISVYLLVFPVTIILPLACIYFGGWNAALIYVGHSWVLSACDDHHAMRMMACRGCQYLDVSKVSYSVHKERTLNRYLIFINSSYGMEASRTASWTPWLRRKAMSPIPVPRWKLWDHFAAYFPARIIKTHDLPADKGPYLFNVAPHGVCVYSAWAAFDTDGCGFPHLFPGKVLRSLLLGKD